MGFQCLGNWFELVAEVTFLALRSLLARALWQRIHPLASMFQEQGVVIPSEVITITSLRLDFRETGTRYVSSLPLKMTAHLSATDADVFMSWLLQRLSRQNLIDPPVPTHDSLITAIWQLCQLSARPAGQLELFLTPAGVAVWLHHWSQQSEETLKAVFSRPHGLVEDRGHDWPMAQRRQLHPEAFIQYLYARCYQLIRTSGENTLEQGRTTKGKSQSDLTQPQPQFACFAPEEQAVIYPLVHLVDHLEVSSLKPEGLWKLGQQLTAATEIWLGKLSATRFLSPAQILILRGVERALLALMPYRLGKSLTKCL